MSNFIVTKDTSIEDLVENVPGAVKYMMKNDIKCIACGEPVWGTLEDAAKEKGYSNEKIQEFVNDLNEIA